MKFVYYCQMGYLLLEVKSVKTLTLRFAKIRSVSQLYILGDVYKVIDTT